MKPTTPRTQYIKTADVEMLFRLLTQLIELVQELRDDIHVRHRESHHTCEPVPSTTDDADIPF